jgi:hypothetical protein
MTTIVYAIPAGTSVSSCNAATCRRPIYWILTGAGKRMPIDASVPEGKVPTRSEPGQGIPHWATCPEATSFKKKATK